jgi:hypothetical protein
MFSRYNQSIRSIRHREILPWTPGLRPGDYWTRLGTPLLPRVGKEGWSAAATAGMESGLGRRAAARGEGVVEPLLQREAV